MVVGGLTSYGSRPSHFGIRSANFAPGKNLTGQGPLLLVGMMAGRVPPIGRYVNNLPLS